MEIIPMTVGFKRAAQLTAHDYNVDYENSPSETGWYPTITCWEPEEGMFPGAHYWDGSDWRDGKHVIGFWPKRFDREQDAEEYARYNDLEDRPPKT
jgi:hypothetical protein